MAEQLERAFRECEIRGHPAGTTALLDRVEARLNDEIPSPLAMPNRDRWWNTLPGPVVAAAAAAAVLLIVVGGVWLFGGLGTSEIEPIEELEEPAITTTVAATTTPPTTVPPQALEAPWVEAGEIRIGSTVITKQSLSVDNGTAILEYDLVSLAPTGTAMVDEESGDPTPAVLPERWELETASGVFEGESTPTGRRVRFEVEDGTTLDGIVGVRLVSWRTIVPVTYDFTIAADHGVAVAMPDGSAIAVSNTTEMATGVWISFDITLPPDHWGAVQCGDWAVGESCFEPVPGSHWTPRQSDSDFQIAADPGTPLTNVPLRYRRPMWIRTEGSVELPLNPPDASTAATADFPDGFAQITDNEAVKPTAITSYGDRLLVSLVSATRRGVVPGFFDPFMGGRWELEKASGEIVGSIGVSFNDRIDGAFTVVFPGTGVEPAAIRLVERWVAVGEQGTTDTGPADSIVGSLDDAPIDVELGGFGIVRVERFDIAGVGGYGTWYVPGDDPLPVVADVMGAFVDDAGGEAVWTESWGPSPRNFGLANTGRLFWFWVTSDLVNDDGLAVLPDGEHRFEVRVDAEVPDPIPADVAINLDGVPVQ